MIHNTDRRYDLITSLSPGEDLPQSWNFIKEVGGAKKEDGALFPLKPWAPVAS